LYFLDPHTQQPVVDLSATVDDMSYHCHSPSVVDISQLDPSVAVVNNSVHLCGLNSKIFSNYFAVIHTFHLKVTFKHT